MGQLKISVQSAADTPSTGQINIYMDATTGLPYFKNAAGVAAAMTVPSALTKKVNDVSYDVVADYGADPTGATDSTAAFNAMIAALNAAQFGGIGYIPVGYYLILGTLTPITQTSVRIIGQSRTNTIIASAQATGDIFSVTGWYCQFEEVQIQGLAATIASGSSNVAMPFAGGILNVTSTANFPSSGQVYVTTNSTATSYQLITYTGKTATSFTGCTGGSGTTGATGSYVLGRISGYAINFSGGNYHLVRHCEFNFNYNILNLSGQNDHIDDLNSRNFAGTYVNISGSNQNMLFTHIFGENPSQATAGIVCTTNLGSLLIDNCGFSQCGITLDLNPGTGITIPTIYATNTFFDTGLYGMRLRGSGSIYRNLFVNCWFSSHTNHGVSIEQANVDGLDFVNCHFFGNAGYGISASGGGQRWSVNGGCKFSGNTSGGISIAPNANSNSQVRITGNTIGPTAAFGANGVGVNIAAGTYTSLVIQQNDVSGNTGAGIVDSSTSVGTKRILDNIGATLLGGIAAFTATSQAGTTTEAQVIAATIPAYALQVGSTFRIVVLGQDTVTTAGGTQTFTVRIGPTSLTGAIAAQAVDATSVVGTAIPFRHEILVTVKSIGTSGTAVGFIFQSNENATGLTSNQTYLAPTAAPVAAAVNTTVANIIEYTIKTSATTSTPTIYLALIEVVKP